MKIALKVVSVNVAGLQLAGRFAGFCATVRMWARKHDVHVVCVQEHNLHPLRKAELERVALSCGFQLTVGFAKEGLDGVHRGGTLILTRESEILSRA